MVALDKDEQQVFFINMRIQALWECPDDQDEEVRGKHIADTEWFEGASCEPIPPFAGEPRELIELDDELLEVLTVASLSGVDADAQIVDDNSQKEGEENDEDNLITM